jgi:hypothetical protein
VPLQSMSTAENVCRARKVSLIGPPLFGSDMSVCLPACRLSGHQSAGGWGSFREGGGGRLARCHPVAAL